MFAFAKTDNIIALPQKNNEWYTPSKYIEAAREVMGGIDLDPASCKEANMVVRAARYYTKEGNGLAQDWHGRVWLNPPYGSTNGMSNIGTFTRRLVAEFKARHIEQAVLLATTKTSSTWFNLLWEYPICFTDHNINFDCPVPNKSRYNGKACHIHGTVLVYLGPHEQKFIDVFSKFGTIAKRVSQPKQTVIPLSLWEQEGVSS